ncbi:50S ribosomal protein L15 [Mucisphaera calidilacus]|uniref:Large ribosomal subunit protein uL15 n=1 Tax=Mucisphaera calidilacus TaxID=2527982 RepID=A0A518BXS5_9BACT|nr:50S ribosomal protein L15 [Mucisphaera calidilacus]QDU71758.1 50S ribosomal protein L15 [Mucisphaera calidilacus]
MMIHEITEKAGAYRNRKRLGRGVGSGHGKTAGRGHNGAGSRSGFRRPPTREGGQMPFFRRMAKRGFTNAAFKKYFAIVNLSALEARFEDGESVTPESLVKVGLIRNTKLPVKILGDGDLTKKLVVTAAKFTAAAAGKIEKAGGSVTVVAPQAKVKVSGEVPEVTEAGAAEANSEA